MIDPVPVVRAAGAGRCMALTVDDGPNGADTHALLDLLGVLGVEATFCLVGRCVQKPGGAELVRRIVGEGHAVANHAWSYADLGTWPRSAIRESLVATSDVIATALGAARAPVAWFRAPNGSWGASAEVAARLGMRPLGVAGTIDDWRTQDVAVLVGNLRRSVRRGGLLTVHDGGGDRSGTVDALAAFLPAMLDAGWTFTRPLGPAG